MQIWVVFKTLPTCFFLSFSFSLKHIKIRLFITFYKESLAVLWRTLTIYNGVAFEKTEVILQIHNAPLISNRFPIKKKNKEAQPLASFVFQQFTKRTHRIWK